jgi:diguanylate cyclase (GGDEF)-like protein
MLHLRFIKDVLGNSHDVLEVNNSSSCLEMLRSINVDYLIIDERVIETEMDQFLKTLEEFNKEKKTAVIMMTTNLKKSFDTHVKKLGADAVIREPLEKENLIQTLKSCNPKDRVKNKVQGVVQQIAFGPLHKDLDIKQRLALNNHAQEQIRTILQEKGTLTLLMIEIDQFPSLILENGEGINDEFNNHLQKLVCRHTRQQDIYIPLGAAKSIIILPKTSKSVAHIIAEEIQKEIQTEKFPIYDEWATVTASIGLVEQKHIEDESDSFKEFSHSLTLAIGYTILAKQKGNQIISGSDV